MTTEEREALDCWSHGLAHLISGFGAERALQIAAESVLAVKENKNGLRYLAEGFGVDHDDRSPDPVAA